MNITRIINIMFVCISMFFCLFKQVNAAAVQSFYDFSQQSTAIAADIPFTAKSVVRVVLPNRTYIIIPNVPVTIESNGNKFSYAAGEYIISTSEQARNSFTIIGTESAGIASVIVPLDKYTMFYNSNAKKLQDNSTLYSFFEYKAPFVWHEMIWSGETRILLPQDTVATFIANDELSISYPGSELRYKPGTAFNPGENAKMGTFRVHAVRYPTPLYIFVRPIDASAQQ